ncbi:uncharacterized protein METZ01_LOCUS30445 [marine metagenome]|uniref:Uncharacterized protein n=1 Tax=marine metagenome TaxID=408172 RepID=A0A381QE29_9ZZZZ
MIIIANATAASAAANTITNKAYTCPVIFIPPNLAKARKLILAEFSINSTPIRTATPLRRVITPYNPRQKRAALTNK